MIGIVGRHGNNEQTPNSTQNNLKWTAVHWPITRGLNPKNQVRAWNQPVYIPKLEENND